jgi:hypothetical protein
VKPALEEVVAKKASHLKGFEFPMKKQNRTHTKKNNKLMIISNYLQKIEDRLRISVTNI